MGRGVRRPGHGQAGGDASGDRRLEAEEAAFDEEYERISELARAEAQRQHEAYLAVAKPETESFTLPHIGGRTSAAWRRRPDEGRPAEPTESGPPLTFEDLLGD